MASSASRSLRRRIKPIHRQRGWHCPPGSPMLSSHTSPLPSEYDRLDKRTRGEVKGAVGAYLPITTCVY
jgi:hypothetical protein